MSKKSRFDLKSYFVKNAVPTEGQFADLIDSSLNLHDDALTLEPHSGGVVIGTAEAEGHLRVHGPSQITGDVVVDGALRVAQLAPLLIQDTWAELLPLIPWSGSVWCAKDSMGMVRLRGSLQRPTIEGSHSVFQLPDKHTPDRSIRLVVACDIHNRYPGPRIVEIDTDGTVTAQPDVLELSLEGVSFWAP